MSRIQAFYDRLPASVQTRAKAIAAGISAAIALYVLTAIAEQTPLTLTGLVGAVVASPVVAGIVHQVSNGSTSHAPVERLSPVGLVANADVTSNGTTTKTDFTFSPKAIGQILEAVRSAQATTGHGELPPPSGRKLGHLPSPRDDRDHVYVPCERTSSPNLTCHNAAGLTFDPLGNLQVGDCAEAGEEHGRQIAAHVQGLTYTPTTTGTLAIYSRVTGYKPGVASTDRGTVLRQMLADLKAEGVISEYQSVPLDIPTLRAAISEHAFVLCGFALPTGAETEGVKWRVPRTGKQAGSWGGHCVPLCGSSTELFDVVSWGEVGTVSHGFVTDYLDEAWTITYTEGSLNS